MRINKLKIFTFTVISMLIFLTCENSTKDRSDDLLAYYAEGEEFSGGETTTFTVGERAFSKNAKNLDFDERTRFLVGNSFFDTRWVEAPASTKAVDGLGPLFNANSCNSCHFRDGRGEPPKNYGDPMVSMLLRLSIPGQSGSGGPNPEPKYGGQLQERGIQGLEGEGKTYISYTEIPGKYADGESYSLRKPNYEIKDLKYGGISGSVMVSPRVAPVMIGMGLLEAIAESDLLKLADPGDKNNDGISGKVNYVWNAIENRKVIGRFGWKANQPNVKQQVAGAFNGDLGLSTSVFKSQNHMKSQGLDHIETGEDSNADESERYEVTDDRLDKVTFYSMHLAVPARRDYKSETVLKGKKLFFEANCNSCHQPDFQTKNLSGFPKLSNQKIYPYTDLLLHDMGKGLADNRPDFEANGQEWRTAPLWGIGLVETVNGHTNFLHDGRARNFEEAILWHGGEAEQSKEFFRTMKKSDRKHLVRFLKSL